MDALEHKIEQMLIQLCPPRHKHNIYITLIILLLLLFVLFEPPAPLFMISKTKQNCKDEAAAQHTDIQTQYSELKEHYNFNNINKIPFHKALIICILGN